MVLLQAVEEEKVKELGRFFYYRILSKFLTGFLLLALLIFPIGKLGAQSDSKESPTEHQWLYGVGHANVLDTYLSPIEYAGLQLGVWHRSERKANWGHQKVTVQGFFGGDLSALQAKSDRDKAWDGRFLASGGWHYNWYPFANSRVGVGGLAEVSAGFTYLLKGGNNPAQARLGCQVMASAFWEHHFRLRMRRLSVRLQAEVPLMGLMFSPSYGQSYYEIFSLGHYERNVRCIHPANAPSFRLQTLLSVPLRKSMLTVGYMGDVRQSHVNGLKHHAWKHSFVIGYTRRLLLLSNK